jgi:hypothetical protein
VLRPAFGLNPGPATGRGWRIKSVAKRGECYWAVLALRRVFLEVQDFSYRALVYVGSVEDTSFNFTF